MSIGSGTDGGVDHLLDCGLTTFAFVSDFQPANPALSTLKSRLDITIGESA
jgi:hypothetical protein